MDRNFSKETPPHITHRSLSARRAWIEISGTAWVQEFPELSLSARRAWIEITQRRDFKRLGLVALRKESVDRNAQLVNGGAPSSSSLSARRAWIEIKACTTITTICIVALRKESVDRNTLSLLFPLDSGSSLSARRAWIEILLKRCRTMRNRRSLSARRAWIEIASGWRVSRRALVALRKESVDRNV